jgi:hypothetical protein
MLKILSFQQHKLGYLCHNNSRKLLPSLQSVELNDSISLPPIGANLVIISTVQTWLPWPHITAGDH